ncbi:carbamate kinase [candidate division MSBL1 archaeon SCGC-AAA261F17]|uniref:Carbamate kinase n=1 Tax=candidate division MSBL1 archaeon SCGC-AAA261F17 TaxID=1698274 RepID=A0A133V816_9EURY|nr:carbamate kinase [candidate division MSBL1 archaeon SCGC-AAA261F17]
MARQGKRIVVALGGNAIKQADEEGTTVEQFKNCEATTKLLAKMVEQMNPEDRLVITHGNGPQAGNLLVQQDAGKDKVPPQDMDVVGAMTQGQISFMLQQTLENYLRELGINIPVCGVFNRVQVSRDDPEFEGENASKPVGNFLTKEEADQLKQEHPEYIVKKVKPKGERCWRRVVPSPDPIANVEAEAIKRMVDEGIIVIASGGGGIPVTLDEDGHYRGVEAVIDKDLAGEKLAEVVSADIFLILTDVEKVKLNFGKPNEEEIDRMTLDEAKEYLDEGHFLPGSMEPKVRACIRFLEWGGEKAVITSLDKVVEALEGKAGTEIIKD